MNPRKSRQRSALPVHQPDATPPGLISGSKDSTDARGGVLLCVKIKSYTMNFGQTTGVR